MSNERPSPGPWRWDNLDENSRVLRHSGSDDTYYSSVFHPDIDGVGVHLSDADAALIADAPRLRDENKTMLDLLRKLEFNFEQFGAINNIDEMRALLDRHGPRNLAEVLALFKYGRG